MKRISASRYWLAKLCPWAFIDDKLLPWDNTPNYHSRQGSAFHKAAERSLTPAPPTGGRLRVARVQKEPTIAEEADRFKQQWPTPTEATYGLATLYGLTPRQEQKLATTVHNCWPTLEVMRMAGVSPEKAHYYHPITGACGTCSDDGTHTYPDAPEGAIAGTVDVKLIPKDDDDHDGGYSAHIVKSSVPWAGDWKTGWYVDHPSKSDQMRIIGLMLAKEHRLDQVTIHILRAREDSAAAWLSHLMDRRELVEVAEESRLVSLSMEDPEPNPGEHCGRCPARDFCAFSQAKEKEKKK